ncbi:MAG: D-Ala-D-Ala carboxypeptidase family metallohydrolase [Gemmatimonadales bacterium]
MTGTPTPPGHRPTDGLPLALIAVVGALAIGAAVALVTHPPTDLLASPFGRPGEGVAGNSVTALRTAFGSSGEVRLQLRMPGELFDFPIEVRGTTDRAEYQWLRASDSSAVVPPRPLQGTTVVAPLGPGFYRLAVTQGEGNRIVDSVVVGVLVPFSAKLGSTLNGYRIGRYQWERSHDESTPPPKGFVQVLAEDTELPVSTHFRLGDFLTHDGQETWPRYLALDLRIVDKVELVLDYLGSRHRDIPVDLHSGYRTPLHNHRVPRAASDSRHQYGDAADLAIDADGDGHLTSLDQLAVSHAVDMVEREHPELVGGLGVYGSGGVGGYVHIDVRGVRKRWRG